MTAAEAWDEEDILPPDCLRDELSYIAKMRACRAENDSVLERWHAGELIAVPTTPDALRALSERLMFAARDMKPFVADNDNAPLATLPVINASEWAHLDPPEREWFIKGLIPEGTVTLVSGDGGVGKSLLLLQIGIASALGVDTLGLNPKPGGVIYVGAEDDEDEFQRRVCDVARSLGGRLQDLEDLEIIPLADRDALLAVPAKDGSMAPTALWQRIRERVLSFGPGLVVFDTTADLFGGDEIKRAQVRQFIAMLRKLAIETGAAVVLLSHPSVSGMQTGSGTSGSTAWSNSVRSRLYLTRPEGKEVDPNARVLRTMKSNYGAIGDEIKLRWQAGAFVLDEGLPAAEMAFVSKAQDEAFVRLLRAYNRTGQVVATTKGVNYAPKVLAEQADAAPYKQPHLERAMQRLLADGTLKVVGYGPPSRQRKQLLVSADDWGGER